MDSRDLLGPCLIELDGHHIWKMPTRSAQRRFAPEERLSCVAVLCEDVGKRLDEVWAPLCGCCRNDACSRSRNGEPEMERFDRITTDVTRMNGEPCIRDLRLTV